MRKEKIKIPLKPLSEKERKIYNFLITFSFFVVLSSFFLDGIALVSFLIILASSQFVILKSNIKDAFSRYLWKGLKFLPCLLAIQIVVQSLIELSNLSIFKMVISINPFLISSPSREFPISTLILTAFFLIFLFLNFNYLEEYYFRDKHWKVIVWCFLHLILGLSTFTFGNFILLFFLGFALKYIYDKYTVQTAYISHFFFNVVNLLIAILLRGV